ncbi:MAG: (d)CMP kinase [Bacteroidetes bacterium]|nr:(d)CMP kinase [Bacteroidota bacterium]
MPEKKIIITLDGWSGCGKSTLAKAMAKALGYVFVDSGAMYRAITLYFIRNQVDIADSVAIEKALAQIQLQFIFDSAKGSSDILMNGENVEDLIREMDVASRVSEVAAIARVRQFAVQQQQRLGEKKGIVMDGRDIGTVVFPQAELKIFMTADKEIRVQRRLKEFKEKNSALTAEMIRQNLEQRDYLDSNRAESPLRQAKDARVLDNSSLSPEQQLTLAMDWVREIIG